jgi:hypothetical protein
LNTVCTEPMSRNRFQPVHTSLFTIPVHTQSAFFICHSTLQFDVQSLQVVACGISLSNFFNIQHFTDMTIPLKQIIQLILRFFYSKRFSQTNLQFSQ